MTPRPGSYLAFDAVAGEYDRTRVIPVSILDDVARLCASQAQLKSGGLFLDAGVGTGRFAAPLSRLYPGQVVGVDVSRPMIAQSACKMAPGHIALVQSDLQRLPFQNGVFQGALIVHVLQLVEQWTLILREMRRILVPRTGVLMLGSETDGRSKIVDHYYQSARARGVLAPNPGTPGLTQAVAWLRRSEGGRARVEALSAPYLAWKRQARVGETLEALGRRTYSQMWNIPDALHRHLMADAEAYARQTFGAVETEECLAGRFLLYTVRWP